MNNVSVILTSFNHEKFIGEAIESVLNQTYQDFELIIWDDASADNSWEIISNYQKKDRRIQAFRNDERQRAVRNINKAIQLSSGEYIAIHHSDDVWNKSKLEKQLEVIASENIGAVFSKADIIDESGQLSNNPIYKNSFQHTYQNRYDWLRFFFFHGNDLCHPSALIRKQSIYECGLYRENFYQYVDYDLWVRLSMRYDIFVIEEKLINFRAQNNNKNTSALTDSVVSRINLESYFILYNFLNINCIYDLKRIFVELSTIPNDTDIKFIPFLLGLLACRPQYKPQIQLFGSSLLFDVMKDMPLLNDINKVFGVTENDLIDLLGTTKIFKP